MLVSQADEGDEQGEVYHLSSTLANISIEEMFLIPSSIHSRQSCPLSTCSVTYTYPKELITHLESAHKIFIYNAKEVSLFIESYCKSLCLKEGDHIQKSVEDTFLRDQLKLSTLNDILTIQEHERQEEFTLPQDCIVCHQTFPNMFECFDHMQTMHRLLIGKLYNLVFVKELLGLLSFLINSQHVCVFCERQFSCSSALRKHCRVKRHYYRIHENNSKYDKYYVINYAMNDRSKEGEEGESVVEDFLTDGESLTGNSQGYSPIPEDDQVWDDWNQPFDSHKIECLFCSSYSTPLVEDLYHHMNFEHHVDLPLYFTQHNLDFYDRIKFVNFVRRQMSLLCCFICGLNDFEDISSLFAHFHTSGPNHLTQLPNDISWQNPQYLLPTFEIDPLLSLLEGFDQEESPNEDDLK